MASPNSDSEIEHVIALERELQTATSRSDESRLKQLLGPNFLEIGASGKRWDRDSILEMLGKETNPGIHMSQVEARFISDDLVQVLWISDIAGNRARRSSLWQRLPGAAGWQLIFHQGTPL